MCRRLASSLAALSLLLLLAAPAQAQLPSLQLSFDGSITGCSDPSMNGPVSFSFTTTGQTSGADTIFTVDFGGTLGNVSIPIPTSEVEALAQAISAAGGTLSVNISEPLDYPGCVVEGTLTFSVLGGGGAISANAPGSVGTTIELLNTGTRSDVNSITSRIVNVLRGRGNGVLRTSGGVQVTGMSAAAGSNAAFGAWAGYSNTDTKNRFATTAFSSDRDSFLLGVDMMPADNVLVGVAMGLERTDVETRFNGGEQKVTGITLAPYLGLLFNDWLSLDASVGYSDVSSDQFRTAGAARVTSEVESTRFFGSLNATATHAFDRLLVSGRAGMLYTTQKDDGFTESNGARVPDIRTNLGRFLLGGELAYSAGAWEPYMSGLFEYDFTRSQATFAPGVARPGNDDTDLLFAVGLRYFGDGGVSGSLEYSKLFGRSNLDEDSINANVRWQF